MKKRDPIASFRAFSLFLGAAFLVGLFALTLINLFTADRTFSEKENRMLASRPDFSMDRLLGGRYRTDAETYVNDQFAGRDFFVSIKAMADQAMGKREANGVYLGRDGSLYEQFTPPDADNLDETIAAMQAFTQRHGNLRHYAMVAPTAVNIYADRLPHFAPAEDQNPYLDALFAKLEEGNIIPIDLRESFIAHRDQTRLYYRTDHHWTTPGAYLAFQSAAGALELDAEAAAFDRAPVTESFQGTLSAKSGFLGGTTEAIEMYFPREEVPLVVNYVEEQQRTATLYASENLQNRDAYAVFLNGNHPLVEIETAADSTRRLLVVKDSYANCFIPFLTPYFSEIVVVDPRYYYGNLDDLVDYYDISEVLYLYNANTFFQDTALRLALEPVADTAGEE